ncbi:HAD family hydrolase [Microbacterium sp. VKM Ac-2870]|uniref:HAD family hydrolase n=1 Tax=Microbacterium sp. VKM Ac-2870 TaxID=2783825 RepID=UPI00188A0D7E|nr:HAD family hydrolase [Microbacterium sp. VKM Ac-2870]MBF4561174.1 HAD family hydrolase [Microbacterium sp. VKM Ac-2870]
MLFDLDDTLLDHSGSARRAFTQWAPDHGIQPDPECWRLWRETEHRFPPEPHNHVPMSLTRAWRMEAFLAAALPGSAPVVPEELGRLYDDYLLRYSESWSLYPDTLDALCLLGGRFRLGILTNGATLMQRMKLHQTGLNNYVEFALVSEEIGIAKPAPETFIIACDRLGLRPEAVLYIGDDPQIDVDGAQSAGLHSVQIIRNGAAGLTALLDLCQRLLATDILP